MGNGESNLKHQKAGRVATAPLPEMTKRRSLSPNMQIPARSSSLKLGSDGQTETVDVVAQKNEVNRRIQQRRAKSFRNPKGRNGSFRLPTCPITGLTHTQKKLIETKWNDLDKQGILDWGKNVFETLFRKEPAFLQAIGLEHLAGRRNSEWRYHLNFRVHVKRFCEALNEVIKSFDSPVTSIDQLQELGALHYSTYQNSSKKLPAIYWEGLVFAITNAAKDLQVESSSRGSESPSNVFDKRFLLPTDEPMSISTPPSPTPFANLGVTPFRRYGSVCPRAAEAWNLLAMYSVSQMRFGYEMERQLQAELGRLGADTKIFEIRGSVGSSEDSTSSSESTQICTN